jgi:site-specific recombinase XerD
MTPRRSTEIRKWFNRRDLSHEEPDTVDDPRVRFWEAYLADVSPSRPRTTLVQYVSRSWRRIVGKAYSPHGLRNAYAGAAHELGYSELTIKALLGHARLGVTSRYVATVDTFLLTAAENVARYARGAMNGDVGRVVQLGEPRASRQANVH